MPVTARKTLVAPRSPRSLDPLLGAGPDFQLSGGEPPSCLGPPGRYSLEIMSIFSNPSLYAVLPRLSFGSWVKELLLVQEQADIIAAYR